MGCVGGRPALVLVVDLLPAEDIRLSASYPHLPALALQVPKGHPRQASLFEYPLVEVVELVELIRRSGLGVEEHIAASFRYPFQEILRSAVEGQQTLSLEDVPVADMKIGPRQGDEFTLPQAAGESCVDERERAQLFRRVQIPLELPQAQGGCFICLLLAAPDRAAPDCRECAGHGPPRPYSAAGADGRTRRFWRSVPGSADCHRSW